VRSPGLSLLVLGCDGSWPGPGGAGSSYLVRSATTTILLDAGPGSWANLQRLADPLDLDAVVLSHHHPDHWSDVHVVDAFFRHATDRAHLPVLAPARTIERIGASTTKVLAWEPVTDGDVREVGDLTLTFRRTDHAVETLAVRVDGGGRSLGYSADTGPGWVLAGLGTGLDLLLCEASVTEDDQGPTGHLSGRTAGALAAAAGARALVITHRRPTTDAGAVLAEAEAAFGRPVGQASIGEEYPL
jgi:ribonuclease BN (tRNA processing enzyme)